MQPKPRKSSKTKYFFFSLMFALIAGAVLYLGLKDDQEKRIETITVERKSVIATVSTPGRVRPSHEVSLAFEVIGKVAHVHVAIGDNVAENSPLVSLENTDLSAQLAEARALVRSEEAVLAELESGTRDEELSIAKIKVQNAEDTFLGARKAFLDVLKDAFVKVDDAIHNKTDQMFDNPYLSTPRIKFSVGNSQLKSAVERDRHIIEGVLHDWQWVLDTLMPTISDQDLTRMTDTTASYLAQTATFLNDVASIINGATPTANITQATIDGWRSDIASARSSIQTTIANVTTKENAVTSASSSLRLEKSELTLMEAGTLEQRVRSQLAKLDKARASVALIEAKMVKTVLRSPIRGVVSKLAIEEGEIIPAHTSLITIIASGGFEIESNVPEVDIVSIARGDIAQVTLDAYGSDEHFLARVVSIDPAEKLIEGVATYRVVLVFEAEDARIRPGMSANVEIESGLAENVIAVPARAVIRKNDIQYTRVLRGGAIFEVPVMTGLRGNDGFIEITEGLAEGEEVITFTEK